VISSIELRLLPTRKPSNDGGSLFQKLNWNTIASG
jgi:hypothetical protein